MAWEAPGAIQGRAGGRQRCERKEVEPPSGFEPETPALRKRCSTVELRWLPEDAHYIGRPPAQSTAFVATPQARTPVPSFRGKLSGELCRCRCPSPACVSSCLAQSPVPSPQSPAVRHFSKCCRAASGSVFGIFGTFHGPDRPWR